MTTRPTGTAGLPAPTEQTAATTPELVACPDCGGAAEIVWHRTCASTSGPVDHAFVLCASGHHFLMPAAGLGTTPESTG